MEKQKDCKVVFLNKQVHEFAFEDIPKAIKYAGENKSKVWAIQTPYGVFQPMSPEEFDNIFTAVMTGPCDEPTPEDLIA